jgi:hypothetical protein
MVAACADLEISQQAQSLQWIFTGNIDEMICTLAHHSPGKRQKRVLEGV